MDACPICAQPHADGKTRKRPRRCKACANTTVVQRRRKDTVLLLQHRWYNSCRKGWMRDANATLWSLETVRYVLQRWEQRSAISGPCAMEDLRIVPYHGKDHGFPKTEELVLVTSREAQMLSKKTGTSRTSHFPPAVAQRIGN